MMWVFMTSLGVIYSLKDGIHPLVVDYDEYYYYKSLKNKMIESLSISNCTIDGDVKIGNIKNKRADLTVKSISPSKALLEKWNEDNPSRPHRLFAQVSANLCTAKKFNEIVKGHYKRAKGCYKVYAVDKHGFKKKRFNDYGATLHPEHIRCENTLLSSVCNGGQTGMQVVPNHMRKLHKYPFLITAKQVIVGRGGMFGMPCGPFGLFASCEAVKWGVPIANTTVEHVEHCRDITKECPYIKVPRVFVMTQYDDTQIGQFMQEALPKLMYHLDFLYANPDIRIHYGFTKQPTVPAFVLPHYFFRWLKLEHRLINGTVYADEVYMPREGGCQDIGYNAWEVVHMREHMLRELDYHESKAFIVKPAIQKPTVLVLTRSPGPYTQNKADYTTRRWPKDKFPLMLQALQENFPGHNIELFSDQNKTLMTCPLCQAQAFFQADIVIGMHGAGLSNAMFMRPGGVLVEVVYDFDARHAPIIGIFPRLSGIIGLHHYTMYIRDTGLDVIKLANETLKFSTQARLYAAKDH